MKNTGQILKEAREKKAISIAEVSLATKINTKIINAIEQGNLSKLPPKTFLRGFVLSYATFLGLDTDHVMKMFQEEMGTTRPSPELSDQPLTTAPTGERSPEAMTRNNNQFAKVAAVIGIILLVVIIIILKKKMDSYESETVSAPTNGIKSIAPDSEINPPEFPTDEAVLPSPTPEDAVAAAPAPSPAATDAPKPTATPLPSPTPKPAVTPTPTPKATATPSPTPTPKPTATPAPSPSPAAVVAPVGSPTPKPTATPAQIGKVQDITIEALDDVSIEATIDGEVRQIVLKAEQVHTIKALRKVSLKISDGGAVSIIVNGIDRGVPGDLGKPTKVNIP